MSGSVDSRIVSMKFDNAAFEKGVATTMSTLQKLKGALNFTPEKKAIDALQAAGNRFSLKGMGSGVEGLSAKFLALSAVGVTAIANITNRAVDAGLRIAKEFTIQPLLDGLHEYETNLKSTQTIAANTGNEGAKGLARVNATLDEMNAFSDQTIYNFSEMARNLGTFTAAGVDLKTAASAIKGIANLAALSGSSSEQASTAMYQLSQAIAAGKVGLQDWNSVVNAGMGGKKFQTALANTALAMGAIEKGSVKLVGPMKKLTINGNSFRESIMAKPGQESWLSSEVLVNTLAALDGRFSKTALAVQGYDEKQIQARINASRLALEQKNGVKYTDKQFRELTKMADAAFKSATEVKTLGQVFDVAKEAMGSGWAATWRLVFGDLNEAKTTFTAVSATVNGFINNMSAARNQILMDWKELGGRTVLIEGIGNVFKALGAILKPIGQAFRDVFPPATGKNLYDITVAFRDFTEGLIISKETAEGIRGVFKAVFTVLDVGLAIVGGFARYFFDLVLIAGQLLPPIFRLAGAFGDLFSRLAGGGKLADLISHIFDVVIEGRRNALEPVIGVITKILDFITRLVYEGTDLLFAGLQKIEPYTTAMWDRFGQGVDWVKDRVSSLVSTIGGLLGGLSGIGDKIGGVFDGIDGGAAKDGAAAAAGGAKSVASAVSSATSVGDKVKVVWGAVMDFFGRAMSAIGRELKDFGGWLKDAGSAIADFVGDVFTGVGDAAGGVTSFYSRLFQGFRTILGGFLDWAGGFFGDFLSNLDFQDALALVNTGTFIALYSMLRNFFKSVSGLADSIGGSFDNLGGLLGQVTNNLKTMQTSVRANIIIKIAAALVLMAGALFILSKVPAKSLKTSLIAITVMLTQLVATMIALEKTTSIMGAAQMTVISVALAGLGLALLALSAAVAVFGRMKPAVLKQGLGVVAGIVTALVAAAAALSATGGALSLIGAAVALNLLVPALLALAGAIKLYSSIDLDTIINGGLKVVGVIVALGLAMNAIPPTAIGGAAALVVVAIALRIVSKVLKDLGGMSIGDTIQTLILLGGALTIMALAVNSMTGALAGAAAMIVVAVSIDILAGALKTLGEMSLWQIIKGLLALTAALVIVGVVGAVLSTIALPMAAFGAALLLMGTGLFLAGGGLALFAIGLASLAVSGAAGFAVLTAGIIAFVELFPLVMQQIGLGIIAFAKVIEASAPALGAAMTAVLVALLKSIADATPQLGNTLIILIRTGLRVVRKTFPDFVRTGMQMIDNLLTGLDRNVERFTDKAVSIVTKFINRLGAQENINKFINAGKNFVVNLGTGIANQIGKTADHIYEKAKDIGNDLIAGVVKAVTSGASSAVNSVIKMGEDMLGGLLKKLKIKSPSRAAYDIVKWFPRGVALAVDDGSPTAVGAVESMADAMLSTLGMTMQNARDVVGDNLQLNPTITPVLDLTQMQNEASRISGLLAIPPLSTSVSLDEASAIARAEQAAREAAQSNETDKDDNPTVKLEQNNYSPKALSELEIYRNTKSLLSLTKEVIEA